jgi:hypothetical protein
MNPEIYEEKLQYAKYHPQLRTVIASQAVLLAKFDQYGTFTTIALDTKPYSPVVFIGTDEGRVRTRKIFNNSTNKLNLKLNQNYYLDFKNLKIIEKNISGNLRRISNLRIIFEIMLIWAQT